MQDLIFQLLLLALFNSLMIIGLYESASYKLSPTGKFRVDQSINLHKQCSGHDIYIPKETFDFEYKMFLWRISFYCKLWFGDFWSKPIATCCVCMSSLHSIYIFWSMYYFFMPHDLIHALSYIVYIPMLAGVTATILSLGND